MALNIGVYGKEIKQEYLKIIFEDLKQNLSEMGMPVGNSHEDNAIVIKGEKGPYKKLRDEPDLIFCPISAVSDRGNQDAQSKEMALIDRMYPHTKKILLFVQRKPAASQQKTLQEVRVKASLKGSIDHCIENFYVSNDGGGNNVRNVEKLKSLLHDMVGPFIVTGLPSRDVNPEINSDEEQKHEIPSEDIKSVILEAPASPHEQPTIIEPARTDDISSANADEAMEASQHSSHGHPGSSGNFIVSACASSFYACVALTLAVAATPLLSPAMRLLGVAIGAGLVLNRNRFFENNPPAASAQDAHLDQAGFQDGPKR